MIAILPKIAREAERGSPLENIMPMLFTAGMLYPIFLGLSALTTWVLPDKYPETWEPSDCCSTESLPRWARFLAC